MGRDTWKNDVKTLFFIFNTFSAVGVGLALFSTGVGTGVLKAMKPWDILKILIGLMYIVIGVLGYCWATKENKKLLTVHTTFMGARSVSDVIELVQQSKVVTVAAGGKGADGVPPEDLLGGMILVTIITMVTTLLSFTLAAIATRSSRAADQEQGTRAIVPIKPAAETSKTFTTQ